MIVHKNACFGLCFGNKVSETHSVCLACVVSVTCFQNRRMFYYWKHVSRNLQQETFDHTLAEQVIETNVSETNSETQLAYAWLMNRGRPALHKYTLSAQSSSSSKTVLAGSDGSFSEILPIGNTCLFTCMTGF